MAGDGRQRSHTGTSTFWIPSLGRVTGGGDGKLGRIVKYDVKMRLWTGQRVTLRG